ncbi:MAG: hypothetical protein J6V66_07445 [Clostridia bacterium]|nr:hypothetical protein [Clostridia bacterium]
MRELYTTKYIQGYKDFKKKLEIRYVIVAIISALLIAGVIFIYSLEPYGTKLRIPFMILMFALTTAFILYSFLFFQCTYGKVRIYYTFLLFSVCGPRRIDKVTVLNVFGETVDKSGIDCSRIVVLEWSDAQNDYVEHTIYIDNEVKVDDIFEGDIITVATNSSCLLAYSKENYETK